MPFTRVLIHYIWATKKKLKPLLTEHIKENSRKKEIFIDTINCVSDHIHLLVSLGTEQTLAKTAMLIKGESSFWVNKHSKDKFEWRDEYIALSVSYSSLGKVRAYIANQEEHHKKKTFSEEYQEFLNVHHLENILAEANETPLKQSTV